MKKVLVLTAIIASSFIATKGYSQAYVGARVGFGHVGFAHPGFAREGVGFPVYHRPIFRGPVAVYAPAPAVIDYNEFPGYGYYNYPAWYGHFRDRVYYEHYRPVFMRSHPDFRGGFRGRR
jgi:hypothetical protein